MDIRQWLKHVDERAAPADIAEALESHTSRVIPLQPVVQNHSPRTRPLRNPRSDDSILKLITAPDPTKARLRTLRQTSSRSRSPSSASSATRRSRSLGPASESSSKLYKRRPRAKPRDGLYEPYSGVRKRRPTRKTDSRDGKRRKRARKDKPTHTGKGNRSRDFRPSNVPPPRVTV